MLIKDKFWQNKSQIRYYWSNYRTRQSLQNWVNIVNDILRLRDYMSTVLNYTKIYEIVRNCTTFEPLICCNRQIKRWTWRGRPTRKGLLWLKTKAQIIVNFSVKLIDR